MLISNFDLCTYAVNMTTGRTVWAYSTSDQGGCAGEVWSSLGSLGVGDSVYFGSGGTADVSTNCRAALHKVDTATGKVLGRSETGIQIQGGAAYGIKAGTVYTGDYDNCMYAVDDTTGVR